MVQWKIASHWERIADLGLGDILLRLHLFILSLIYLYFMHIIGGDCGYPTYRPLNQNLILMALWCALPEQTNNRECHFHHRRKARNIAGRVMRLNLHDYIYIMLFRLHPSRNLSRH